MTNTRKRILSMVLAVIMLLSTLPFSAMAAPASDLPANMVDSAILRALEYTGYDVQKQKSDGTLYQSGSYGSGAPSSVRSNIGYGTGLTGMETVSNSSTPTGKAPNIARFEQYGLCCASFVTYYICNYIPNIEGGNTQFITDAINSTGTNPQAVVTWQTALNNLASSGKIEKIGTSSSNVNRSKLAPGDLIIFGNSSNTHVHIGVYSGTYKGTDFLIHVGNDRGPEILPVDWMGQSGDKSSYPNAYYHLPENIISPEGKITIRKYDKDTNASLAGAVFTATLTSDTSKQYKIGPTGSDGYASIDGVPLGTYKIVETVFPANYRNHKETEWTISITENTPNHSVTLFVANEKIPGKIQIIKTADDGNVGGIEFSVSGNGFSQWVKTDSSGKITIPELKPGTYTITEFVPSKYEPQQVQTVTVVENQTTTVNFNNTLKRGQLMVTKTSEDGLVEGVQFKLSGTSLSGQKIELYTTTSSRGVAGFTDIPISTEDGYVLEEINTAERYIVPAKQNVIVEWNKIAKVEVYNKLKRGDLKVTKISEDGLVVGMKFKLSGTSLSGEKIEVFATTDSTGVATFNDILISGSNGYVIEEVETAERYIVPSSQNAVIEWNKVTNKTFRNDLKRGDLEITKTSEDGLVEGMKFKLSGTSFSGATVELFATTNKEGIATFNDVLISDKNGYVIEEIETANRYIVPQKQNAVIEWNKVTNKTFHNELKRGDLRIVKTSEDNFVEGLKFKLSGTSLSGEKIELYATTDAEGVATFNDVLISGNIPYRLEEVNTPEFYITPEFKNVTIQWNKVTGESFYNILKRSDIKVIKTSEDGLVEGMKFKLSGTSLSGAKVELIATTNKDGIAIFKDVLISGKNGYVLEEIETAERYIIPDSQNAVIEWEKVTENSFHNELKRGDLKVIKTSEDNHVQGIKFKLTGTSLSGHNIELYATTNAEGVAIFEDVLISGHTPYILEEVDTAEYYIVPPDQKVAIEWNKVTQANIYNELKRGELKVTKTSEDGLVEGVKFHLYGTSMSGIKVDEYAVTDKSGVAVFKNILIGDNFTLEEVDTAIRYVVPAKQKAHVEWKTVTENSFKNILKKWRIDLYKLDKELHDGSIKPETIPVNQPTEPAWPYGHSQGDATLTGAVYGIFNNGVLVDTYITDANGYFITDYYVCGDNWTIKEITPSNGYLLDPTVYQIDCSAENYTVELNTVYFDVYEQIIKGKISIIKHADDGSTQIETPEVGAEFEVYLSSAGSFENAKETERALLVCDEYGFAETGMLPYGTYVVKQTKGSDGKALMPPFTVKVEAHEENYRFLINNAIFTADIVIQKKDVESGKLIPIAGVGFKVRNKDTGELIIQHINYPTPTDIEIYYTDSTGQLMLPEALPFGNYEIIEQCTAYGYVLDGTPVSFKVDGSSTVVTVTKSNMAQKGTISITKSGEVFSSVIEKDGVYQPVYAVSGLEGAIFSIYAVEDIYTPDGTLRYSKGEKVDTITTGKDGIATSQELYLGKYEIREHKAPYGMILNSESVFAELTYAGENITITSTSVSMSNERQKVILDLSKSMEKDELFKLGTNNEVTKVSFGLYAAEDIIAKDGKMIPKDGLIEKVVCNSDGKAVFISDIPVGSKLYVKEIATDSNYILSDTAYSVEFVYAGQNVATVLISVNDGNAVDNKIIRGSIEGLKIDEDGKAVEGVVFGLFWKDTTEFTEETAVLTTTTNADGVFAFSNIPIGNWLVKELSCPEQFVLSDEVFNAEITTNDQIIYIEAVNKYISGNIEVTKTDADYGDTINGAVFEIYSDVDGDMIFNADVDKLIATIDESEQGKYIFEGLRYGGYFLLEVKAPPMFFPNSEYHYFAIVEDGKTVTIETTEGKGFENQPYKGDVKVIKTDSDTGAALSGAVFEIYKDVNGNKRFDAEIDLLVGTLSEDNQGTYLFEGLHFGGYFLYEAVSPAYYNRDENYYHFTIDEDGQVILIETNEGKGFENQPFKSNIKIIKKDADTGEVLSGVEFGLFDLEGNEIVRGVTDENGELIFENIRFGSYELRELAAPKGYQKNEEALAVEITKSGEELIFEVSNKKLPELPDDPHSPQTGDNSNIGLWFTVMMISLAAFISLSIYGRKSRREN